MDNPKSWYSHTPWSCSSLSPTIPLLSTVFGLYRPGSELRGVFYKHKRRVMQACDYWRTLGKGCDEPILLGELETSVLPVGVERLARRWNGKGNDPLYGGLGGTPT